MAIVVGLMLVALVAFSDAPAMSLVAAPALVIIGALLIRHDARTVPPERGARGPEGNPFAWTDD